MLTEKTFTAKSFYINDNPITRLHQSDISPRLFYNTHHFMSYCDTRNRTWNTSMFYMQITGTNTAKGNTYNSVTSIFQLRFRLLYKFKFTLFNIGICQHSFSFLKII